MTSDPSGASAGDPRLNPIRLIAKLNALELSILNGLIAGMSRGAIAAEQGLGRDEAKRNFVSLMRKLNARTIADAVRIALSADAHRPD